MWLDLKTEIESEFSSLEGSVWSPGGKYDQLCALRAHKALEAMVREAGRTAYKREWRHKNREKVLATRAAWREANRARVNAKCREARARRAARINAITEAAE